MNLDDARLAPAPGDTGLACRFPGVVLYCAARGPQPVVADLIGRCREASAGPDPGIGLARSLAGVLSGSQGADTPPFALVAKSPKGLAVLINGALDVRSSHVGDGPTDTEEVLSGAAAITWVDRVLPGEYRSVSVHHSGAPSAEVPSDADLVAGVVPAGGLFLDARVVELAAPPAAPTPVAEPVSEPAPEPETAPVAAEWPAVEEVETDTTVPNPAATPGPPPLEWSGPINVGGPPTGPAEPPTPSPPPDPTPSIEEPLPDLEHVQFESVLLHSDGADDDHDHERVPLPVEPDPAESRAAESELASVVVQGVLCSRGHFNDPRSRFCSSCGISMVHQTQNLVPGPRPPLGVLVFEDGTTYSLSNNYVIGRQPEVSELVKGGSSLPLQLDDSERTISRAHAELRLEGWDVWFLNLSDTNGSFVWDSNIGQWIMLGPGQPVVLAPGTRIAMGRRTAVFESSLVR